MTWDAAVRVARVHGQLQSAQREILALESLLASRKARWEITVWSTEL